MSDTVSQIKEKLDIVEFIRSYLQLLPAGKNFKANCPFHSEKTPSFMVSAERQSWHCFGCSLGGDIFSFLMRYENIEFYEALKVLSEKAGVELKRVSPQEYKQFGVLYDINNSAKDYYKKQLQYALSGNDQSIHNYLVVNRGLKKETIDEFDLGLSSSSFDGLTKYLIGLGYDINDIVRAGLVFRNDRGLYQDRFRNRIMFPIANTFGKVVGFTARILPSLDTGDAGKYINSPETPIFIKSRFLYGLHKSKKFVRDEGKIFLVEGPMDFLMSFQDGVYNIGATMGTALTLLHLNLIKRLTNKIVLSFDNDEAGQAAGERAIDLCASADFDIEVIIMKDFKDMADFVKARPGELKSFITNPRPSMEFYFERYLPQDNELDRQKIRIVLSKIKTFSSPIERGKWLKSLSERTGLKEEILLSEVNVFNNEPEVQKSDSSKENPGIKAPTPSRKDYITQKLITLVAALRDPAVLKDLNHIVPAISSEILKEDLIHHRANLEESVREKDDIMEEIVYLKKQLVKEYYEEKRKLLSDKIRTLELANDEIGLRKALEELSGLLPVDI